MVQLFISYVEEDSTLAFETAKALEAKGYSTWLYERDSVPGPSYLLQTGEAIDEAEAIVLIVSHSSVLSNQVTSEVIRAHEHSKPFIPLLHEISHSEFQERAPIWRQALASYTSISFSANTADSLAKVTEGLIAMGVASSTSASTIATPSLGVFVGREKEMAELRVALDDAMAGHGRLVMLVGEPGIGKTRLSQELAATAEQRGAQVLWGRCYEEEGAPPYWPWIQPLTSYVQSTPAEELRSQLGTGASDVAQVIPEIKDKLSLEAAPELDPQQA